MQKENLKGMSIFLSFVLLFSGCSMSSQAQNFNGLTSPDGKPIAHISTSNIALHLLGSKPLIGDASLERTVSDFTAKAQNMGASKVRIVQSSKFSWWFILFPISLVLTPVTSNVAGEAL